MVHDIKTHCFVFMHRHIANCFFDISAFILRLSTIRPFHTTKNRCRSPVSNEIELFQSLSTPLDKANPNQKQPQQSIHLDFADSTH